MLMYYRSSQRAVYRILRYSHFFVDINHIINHMSTVLLSSGEKAFILEGIEADVRSDGRTRRNYRPMEIETDIISHANGSARLRLANTDVLVGIKVEVDDVSIDSPESGKIEFFVDCSANATPMFEGRGGEDLATELSSALFKAYNVFPLRKLCIVPHRKCWKLYTDILILECAGNLYDAVSLAVKAAMDNTRIPKIKDIYNDGTTIDLEFSDDPYDCWKLDLNTPCLITLCKIGDYLITDATAEEETCGTGSIIVSVTKDAKITAIVKTGDGSFHPNTVNDAIKLSAEIGKDLNKAISDALQNEEKLGFRKEKGGFLR